MKKRATPSNISCLLNGKGDTRDRGDTVDIGNTRKQKEHKGNNGTHTTQGNTEETGNTR